MDGIHLFLCYISIIIEEVLKYLLITSVVRLFWSELFYGLRKPKLQTTNAILKTSNRNNLFHVVRAI